MATVRYETKGAVGILTIDRPEALNALSSEVLEELSLMLDGVDLAAVRALVLTGAGEKAFVAGADIAEMQGLTKEQALAFSKRGNDVFLKIERFPIPVIAAVNGYALGGGCELAMCCDIRLCSDKAVFGQPEVTLGIPPGFGGTQRLSRIIGLSRAKEMIFSARNIKAAEALSLGLVSAVYAPDELLKAALALAERIALNAPIAVRAAKRAMNVGIDQPIERAVDTEAALFGDCFETADQREAMQAFLEKRKLESFQNR